MKQPLLACAITEIPVRCLTASQKFYRNNMGFAIAWTDNHQKLCAMQFKQCIIYLKETSPVFHNVTSWLETDDIYASYKRFEQLGAYFHMPIEKKPWGHTQFAICDLDNNIFHIHQKTR